jgi:predicted enzyme related to lactoylglutathione lyase
MIQIDGIKRQVFIKMTNIEKVQAVINATGGEIDYTYPTGQISTVTLAVDGLGTKRIRVANLPPEVSHDELRAALTPYGKTVNIKTEKWSNNYRYSVDNSNDQTRPVPSDGGRI